MNCRKWICAFALCGMAANAVLAQDGPDASDGSIYEADEEDFAIDREGERCINARQIRDTDILNERTVLFKLRGGDYYLNYLDNRCRGLVREKRFAYRTHTGRLCQVDTIRVLYQFGGYLEEGMACGLGMFYPITEEEAEFLALEPEQRRGGPAIRVTNPNADGEADEAEAGAAGQEQVTDEEGR